MSNGAYWCQGVDFVQDLDDYILLLQVFVGEIRNSSFQLLVLVRNDSNLSLASWEKPLNLCAPGLAHVWHN